MKIVENGKHYTILIPDEYLGGKVAALDDTGWLSLGYVGDGSILIDNAEWADFVKFIQEIDAYRKTWPVKEE